ncbi:class I SAM-dependent methyltransferase [Paenibacillus sp. GP183]|uniref:class I SAM-dependent methyltransferase n=1 Tax=Paenibacillus sp. GP183 TaxID=1882751 RepID=UPI00089A1512|nr:class I SAM-dependent methyltransferase [Paenibacillus sp. GP183]SEB56116.1 Ubiquinone/menaquinone biosynthesis C-methylase UbiE [Paenibacillus sp. GP183]
MSRPIYDLIGVGYDTTRKADPEITRRLQNHLQIFDSRPVIDIACGSGNYTLALHNLGLNVCGMDLSPLMIDSARKKSKELEWYLSDVENMTFLDGQFNGAVCILAIHHFRDLVNSFKEINRILCEGSRFVIFTSSPEQMQRYWLKEYFPEMMNASISQMPNTLAVEKALLDSGFQMLGYESFMIQPNLQDFFLYSGKYRPEIYLRPEVRNGISSFASLACEDEVNEGTKKLEEDLKSGIFKQRSKSYVSELGDYLYIVAEKPHSFV